jgi:tRNA pseudouridine38-40 synthase
MKPSRPLPAATPPWLRMPRFKLILEYDGAPFVGWQRQENGLSVQEALESALTAMTGAHVTAHGAGRTDAGVHALGQVAHVELERDWDPFRLSEGLNALVHPHPVAIIGAERVTDDFDARHSASARHYLYRIVNRRAPLTFGRGQAWRLKPRLDAEAMHEAARTLIGRHDFSTFRDSQCQAKSPIRTLDRLDVRREGDEVLFEASARSFLHRQVRSMVGSLVEVGSGRWSVGDFKAAFEAADRSRCGQVAPAHGLYLVRVDYVETQCGDGRLSSLANAGEGEPPEGRWRGSCRPMRAPSTTMANARRLRRALSPPEARMWNRLRQRAPGLPVFRRQHPIGPYVLDFYCAKARLAIEIDGMSHDVGDRPERDLRRDAWLEARGVTVVRIPAGELTKSFDEAVDAIVRMAVERIDG